MNLFVQAIYLASGLSLGYIFLLYRSNPLRRLPASTVTISFVVGMVAVIPVIIIKHFAPLLNGSSLFTSFVSAGTIEEGVKFALMALTIWRFSFPDLAEPLDFAIYFGILGVGFGIYEDFSYLFSGTYSVWKAGDIGQFHRALQALVIARVFPGHILFDSLAGFLIGHARFLASRRVRGWWIAGAFILAVALHGSFDMIAIHGGTIPLLTYVAVLVAAFLYLRRRALERSPFRATIAYVMGETDNWQYPHPPVDYLFADGFSWPGVPKRGMYELFPLTLSLVILYPLLVVAVYLLERATVWLISL
ncbi:MAG TPA: PrsW family intramembrane metalloprotease [Candidatus Acetothermia bacterium]|nr:PrsW family intramembrane metalloprotease [Candidatus Acetothermia bacterium]